MNEKLLTVSIAAYNVEDCLEAALDSCLVNGMENLEIIVVDDGSSDRTKDISLHYAHDYPSVFRVISKENGGYGSTVNASLDIATGKYYRLLDGDDWFDKEGLEDILSILEHVDCDAIITPFNEVRGSKLKLIDQARLNINGVVNFTCDCIPSELSMHSLTYRTDIIRKSRLHLPEHRLYTDSLFVATPLANVKTAYVSHKVLYQYRVGRDGQSISLESEMRHREDKKNLINELEGLYFAYYGCEIARSVIGLRISGNSAFMLMLLYSLSDIEEIRGEIRDFISELRRNPEIYALCRRKSEWFRLLTVGNESFAPIKRAIVRQFGYS